MSSKPAKPADDAPFTELCTHSNTSIHYRNASLVDEILGKKTFTEVLFSQITGRDASRDDLRLVDAVLIAIMEHGLTPSAISTRLVYMSAPENLQGAVAAGLLAVGSQFIGTVENCATNLEEIIADPAGIEAASLRIAQACHASKQPIPGFGQHLHKPDDPRAARLIEIGREHTRAEGRHLDAIQALSRAVDATYGKHITINATGAVAALLGELQIPTRVMRGFAVISRAAGLVAHVAEEQRQPAGRFIWGLIDEAVPYRGKGKGRDTAGE
jgi:citrate synthase